MLEWCKDKQHNMKIMLLTENKDIFKELSFEDIGLLYTKKEKEQHDLF